MEYTLHNLLSRGHICMFIESMNDKGGEDFKITVFPIHSHFYSPIHSLQDHVHDVHAFCRSKCLGIWVHIVNADRLPRARPRTVLELAAGRLKDRSSHVRKHAVQLVTALLRHNPFAGKVSQSAKHSSICVSISRIQLSLSAWGRFQ